MEWFTNWWGDLSLVLQVLYCIAIPGTLLLIIQTILVIFGIGGEGGDFGAGDIGDIGEIDVSDVSGGSDAPSDFGIVSLFTFQGIVAFFCIFGWSGIVLINMFGNIPLALLIGFILGAAAMVGVAKVIRITAKLAYDGTADIKLLIGESGVVYIPIPEDKSKRGKVNVQMSERMFECEAISESGALATNTPVRVTDIIGGNVLVVEKI